MEHPLLPGNFNIEKILKFAYDENGEFRIRSYYEWAQWSYEDIRLLMHVKGLYSIPTEEVVEFLDNFIGDSKCIEICAGTGLWGHELGMPTTDSKLQEREDVKAIYASLGQPTIKYPSYVQKMEAIDAVKHYRPYMVFGSYVTPKWEYELNKGNKYGVDEVKLSKLVKCYIKIGTLREHEGFKLMRLPHTEIYAPELITRSNRGDSRIFVWIF